MNGNPFAALKRACLQTADTIFGDNPQDDVFREVHTIFYDDLIFPKIHTSKKSFLETVQKEEIRG